MTVKRLLLVWASLLLTSTICSLILLPPNAFAAGSQGSSSQYGNQLANPEEDGDSLVVPKVTQLHFVEAEGKTYLKYYDVDKDKHVVTKVPRYFETLSDERIAKEVEYRHTRLNGKAWRERVVLELLFYSTMYGTDHVPKHLQLLTLEGQEGWLDETVPICKWKGITCGSQHASSTCAGRQQNGNQASGSTFFFGDRESSSSTPPPNRVTKIEFTEMDLEGTLPTELYQLEHLRRLNLNDNALHGTIPSEYGLFKHLNFLDIGANKISGTVPKEIGLLNNTLREIWLENNNLHMSTFPEFLMELTLLEFLDISNNKIYGSIPTELGRLTRLESFFIEENWLTGSIVTEIGKLSSLKILDLSGNKLDGTLPSEIGKCTSLVDFNLVYNEGIYGSLPTEIFLLRNLEGLLVSYNQLSGQLPTTSDPDLVGKEYLLNDFPINSWANLRNLVALGIDRNRFTGTLPTELFVGLGPTLTSIAFGYNMFTGTLPTEVGLLTLLERITGPSNKLTGQLPDELGKLTELAQINFTSNLLTGEVPPALCSGSYFDSMLIKGFGCDAILCPPGTFHPDGAASVYGGCVPCPEQALEKRDEVAKRVLGRSKCPSVQYMVGDINGDGVVSVREALRILYLETGSGDWGISYNAWQDLNIPECSLPGITCVNNEVTKIDLGQAELCGANGDSGAHCPGLPGQIGLLSSLEELVITNRRYFRSTLPTEIGLLSKLRLIDLSQCPYLTGTIPTSIGLLTNLRDLKVLESGLKGSIVTELFSLSSLETLTFTGNALSGTLSTYIGELQNVRELFISRNYIKGEFPSEIGNLTKLENLESYGNLFTGQLPNTIGNCKRLKRADLYNNNFTGTIPNSFGQISGLQILHLKNNALSGTIPENLSSCSDFKWLDLFSNYLEGTIPSGLGSLQNLKHFNVGDNRLYGGVPPGLCSNLRVNGGLAKHYGCDSIICPLGTYAVDGLATVSEECKECPEGQTTMYLGSTSCMELSTEDLLSMFFEVMDGEKWPEERKKGWKNEGVPMCSWSGITCDGDGEIVGLSFPLLGSDNT